MFFVFFKQQTAYDMRISDWSSDVCTSDLKYDVAASAALRFIHSRFRVTDELHGARFFVKLTDPGGVRSVWFATDIEIHRMFGRPEDDRQEIGSPSDKEKRYQDV